MWKKKNPWYQFSCRQNIFLTNALTVGDYKTTIGDKKDPSSVKFLVGNSMSTVD